MGVVWGLTCVPDWFVLQFCAFLGGVGRVSESELLLVTRPNDIHSPGPVSREVSP